MLCRWRAPWQGRRARLAPAAPFAVAMWIACLSPAALAWDYTPNSIPGLAALYGYLNAQSLTLDRAAEQFPSMRAEITLARAQFDRQFPDALPAVSRIFQGIPLPTEDRARLATKVMEVNAGSVEPALASEHALRAFLRRVRDSARGEMEPNTLQLLLSAIYDDRPALELSHPLARVYRTRGLPGAADVDLYLRMPRSWARDDEREKIQDGSAIFAFTSQGGVGQSTMDLVVRPGPQDAASAPRAAARTRAAVTPAQAELIDNLRFLTGTTPRVLAQGPAKAPLRRATWASFSIVSDGNSGKTVQYGRAWFIPVGDSRQLVMLLCMTPPLSEAGAEVERSRLDPLWEAVASSISFPPSTR